MQINFNSLTSSAYENLFINKHWSTIKSTTYLVKGRHYNLRSIIIVNKVDETIRSRRGLLDFPRKPKIVGTSHKSVKSTIAQHNTTFIRVRSRFFVPVGHKTTQWKSPVFHYIMSSLDLPKFYLPPQRSQYSDLHSESHFSVLKISGIFLVFFH